MRWGQNRGPCSYRKEAPGAGGEGVFQSVRCDPAFAHSFPLQVVTEALLCAGTQEVARPPQSRGDGPPRGNMGTQRARGGWGGRANPAWRLRNEGLAPREGGRDSLGGLGTADKEPLVGTHPPGCSRPTQTMSRRERGGEEPKAAMFRGERSKGPMGGAHLQQGFAPCVWVPRPLPFLWAPGRALCSASRPSGAD